MKKIVLSFFVITAFILYSLYQKMGGVFSIQNPQPSLTDSTPANTPVLPAGIKTNYKDGEFTGEVTDAYYGNIQVKAIILGGRIKDVQFLQYPNDRGTSIEINRAVMPQLTQEAITAQSAQVDIVSGATQSSQAFRQSLQSALGKAKI